MNIMRLPDESDKEYAASFIHDHRQPNWENPPPVDRSINWDFKFIAIVILVHVGFVALAMVAS